MKYVKRAGSPITARFSYYDTKYDRWYDDSGKFTQSAGQTRSFAWNNTDPECVMGQMGVDGQGGFVTPSICR
jgi:hypothetical protein